MGIALNPAEQDLLVAAGSGIFRPMVWMMRSMKGTRAPSHERESAEDG